MKEKMDQLVHVVLKHDASDVHFVKSKEQLNVSLRTMNGMKEIYGAAFDQSLYQYLKYESNMDLTSMQAQSGNFTYLFEDKPYYFRFSCIHTLDKETAVLRILNNHAEIQLEDLSDVECHLQSFKRFTHIRSGLVILSGPTGSGKTTTLHALLKRIATQHKMQVVSLEDPIEIYDDAYLQLQINEKMGFGYEEGIRQLMRHDPDVIMIGEIRDPGSARMLLRSALSGHMIFTTIHAKCCSEAIKRLYEFGLKKEDLMHTLTAVCSQRLYASKQEKRRYCVYEILEGEKLQYYFQNETLPQSHKTIFDEIQTAVDKQKIKVEDAAYDLPFKAE